MTAFTVSNGEALTYTYTTLPDESVGRLFVSHGINVTDEIVGVLYDSSSTAHGFLYSGGTHTILNDPSATNGTFA